jgi:hypothetical protein
MKKLTPDASIAGMRKKTRWVKVCPVEELPPQIRELVLTDKIWAELVLKAKI